MIIHPITCRMKDTTEEIHNLVDNGYTSTALSLDGFRQLHKTHKLV